MAFVPTKVVALRALVLIEEATMEERRTELAITVENKRPTCTVDAVKLEVVTVLVEKLDAINAFN